MSKLYPILLAALTGRLLTGTTFAQETEPPLPIPRAQTEYAVPVYALATNVPKTALEAFEVQTGVIVVEGSVVIGSVYAEAGVVTVKAKESRDARSGRKASGLQVEVRQNETYADATTLDADELDSFLDAIDYISKADYKVTPLPNFDVVYTTKGGLRLATFSSSRSPGTIRVALQSDRVRWSRVILAPQQLAQFHILIQQAKTKLDSLRLNK